MMGYTLDRVPTHCRAQAGTHTPSHTPQAIQKCQLVYAVCLWTVEGNQYPEETHQEYGEQTPGGENVALMITTEPSCCYISVYFCNFYKYRI